MLENVTKDIMQKEIMVIKRDGRKELLDITKIQKFTKDAVKDLSGVSQSELEIDARLYFKDGISTAGIQESLIKTAVEKISIESPNWTFVAARLFLYDLYHKVSKCNDYVHLKDYFERCEKENKILKGFKEKYDLEYLNAKIDISRDLEFNYLGIKTLYDRYLLKDANGNPIELPQHMFMSIAMFLAQNEKECNEWAIKFYDMISSFEVMCATPTLANARTPRHQLSSCYVCSMPDSIEGIFDTYKEMALLSKYGGGIGCDFSQIRALASSIDNHKNAGGGIIPFLKITNDVAIAVDQLGTRRGAVTVYIEIWHKDMLDFIDLRKNSGEERRRTHDLFLALWICDLFMKRLENNETWHLFNPYDCIELTTLHDLDFEKRYVALENDALIEKETILAKELWKKILISYFESGMPFLCFKDAANIANPNPHVGFIRSSNLCTEIFQNTEANSYVVEIEYEDASREYYNETDIIITDKNISKKACNLTCLDSIKNKRILHISRVAKDGETAVCNLASINLSKINTKQDLERVVPIAIRMLDNVIDLNFYPIKKAKLTNAKNRAIGLGIMGEAQMLASQKIHFGSEEHKEKIDTIMEYISYYAINASSDLAAKRGAYPSFENSNWQKGIFPIDIANENAKSLCQRKYNCDWEALRNKVKIQGIRNGYLLAVAPTSSISILVGTTQTIEPVYSLSWHEENLSGVIKTVVPNLNLETIAYYKSAYNINQLELVKLAAIRQKWIDQGQSLNIFVRPDTNAKTLHEIYMLAWKLGLKSTYYLRSQTQEIHENLMEVLDRKIECESCQ